MKSRGHSSSRGIVIPLGPGHALVFESGSAARRGRADGAAGTAARDDEKHGAGFTAATLLHSSGTSSYSPPEYLAGKTFTVQGDVYSLGVMRFCHESKTKRRTR
jgi:serine/threonine protein kinase